MKYNLVCDVRSDEDGMTVKGVLRRNAGVSRRLIRSIIHGDGNDSLSGGVYVNDKPAIFIDKVSAGDKIGLVYPEEATHIEPENIPIDILYEDEDFLALNKQAGIVVHPTKGHPAGTIANGVVAYMEDCGEEYKPRFVNRLDMFTSGVLLVGKNSHVQSAFTSQSGRGETVKKYLVAVNGIVADDEGVIDLPIKTKGEGSPRRTVSEGGAESVTRYKVLSRNFLDNIKESNDTEHVPYTTLEVILGTGRTHQIRVHFSHIGHSVIGDSLYGDFEDNVTDANSQRQVLHACSLEFSHPRTGERLIIEAPLPNDIINFFK